MEHEEHSFIKETIKEKPMSSRKKATILFEVAVCGAVFGLMACLFFYLAAPWASVHVSKEDDVVIANDDRNPDASDQGIDGSMGTLEALTAEDYQTMMKSVNDMMSDVNRSVAVITASDPFSDLEESLAGGNSRSVNGLLVAETNNYLLFLIPMKDMIGYSNYSMSFGVGASCDGTIRAYDANTGLGIMEVAKSGIDGYLSSYYRVATLGNSYAVEKGTPIIALGSPFGINNALAMGVLSSKNGVADIEDADFSLLVSDIIGASDTSGVFVNLKGEVLGIMMPDQSVKGSNVLTALSISEIKDIIERLSNHADIPYVGISGSALDSAMAEEYGLPEGIYVTGVAMDSPAMEAGIQIGDVITEVNGTSVLTMDNYHDVLMSIAVGKEIRIKGSRVDPEGLRSLNVSITIGALK